MKTPEWDVNASAERDNILRIVKDLRKCENVPLTVSDAILSLLKRAELAESESSELSSVNRESHHMSVKAKDYKRNQPYIQVTFTCSMCGKVQTIEQLPGATPIYCEPCRKEVNTIANRERVRNYRKRQKLNESSKP